MGGPAPQAAPPPAQSGSSAGKIIVIIIGALLFMGLLGTVGLFYVGYKAKQKFEQVVKEEWLEKDDKRPTAPAKPIDDMCSLLSADDAAAILDVKIVRAENRGKGGCAYFTEQATESKHDEGSDEARKVLEQIGKRLPDDLSGAAAVVNVTPGGRQQWTGIRVATRMLEMVGVSGDKKTKVMEDVPGLGDRAVSFAGGTLIMVLKDDYLANIAIFATADQEKRVEFARRVVSKL